MFHLETKIEMELSIQLSRVIFFLNSSKAPVPWAYWKLNQYLNILIIKCEYIVHHILWFQL